MWLQVAGAHAKCSLGSDRKGGRSDAVKARDCEAMSMSPESSPPCPDDEAEWEMKRAREMKKVRARGGMFLS